MQIKRFFALLLLSSCGLMATAVGQQIFPPNIGPLPFAFNGASGTFVVPNINGQSFCTVTVPSTATMGSGTNTMKTSADNGANYFSVTGLPDLGAGTSASSTITVAGTQLTAPVSGKTNFEVVLSGASGAAITGNITCGNGSASLGANSGGGGSNVTIVAPTGALPVASAGASPVTGVNGISQNTCAVPAGGTPNVTGGNEVATQCNANGQQLVHDPAPVFTALQSVTTPAPAPTTTGGWVGTVGFNVGTGALYANNICDTFAMSGAISTAVTTLLITGTNNQSVYVCLAAWESTGTNASNTVNYEYGQGATCQTNTQTIFPAAVAPGTATGEWTVGWGNPGAAVTAVAGMPGVAPVPLVLPNNATAYNFCGVTAGTTTAGRFVVWYSVH